MQRQCTSAVTEMDQDAFVGSSMENGTTLILWDLRQHDLHQEWGTQATRCGRQASSHVDVPALSTFHHPMRERCLVAQGSSLEGQHPRLDCTPESKGVSPSQPLSHRGLRVACDLAVVCGVRLRPMALLCAALCLRPMTTSSINRGLADLGSHFPPPAQRLQPRRARTPVTEGPRAGDDPLGTEHGVMGRTEAQARLLRTQAAASAPGAAARPLLHHVPDRGLQVTAACSDDAQRCTEASTAVCPQARWPADHVHPVKQRWGHLKKARVSSRRHIKAQGEEKPLRRAWNRPRRYGSCVGASSSSQPMALLRQRQPWQTWQERTQGGGTASAVGFGSL